MASERQAEMFFNSWLVYSRNAWVLRVKNWDDVFLHESNETRIVSHVADPLTCAKPATLDRFWTHIAKLVVIKRQFSHNCGVLGILIL